MSSTAQHVEDLLLDFAYGELSASDAQRVQAHLDGCAECRQSLEQMQGVRKVMSQLPHEAAPDAGLESLLAYAEQSARRTQAGPPPKPTWWRKLLAPVTAVAAVAAIGVIAHEVNKDATTPEQVVSSAIAQRVSEAEPQLEEHVQDDAPPPPMAQAAPSAAPRKRSSITRAAPMKDLAAAPEEGMTVGRAEFERKAEFAERAQALGGVASPPPAAAPMAGAAMDGTPRREPARRKMASVESAPQANEYDRSSAAAERPAAVASPNAAQLSAQAQAAHDRGDLGEEARLLREAVAVAPRDRVVLGNLLLRLCDAEYQLGNAEAGARACQRAADEFPGTSTAIAATRRIADHGGRGRAADAPAATSAPAQTAP